MPSQTDRVKSIFVEALEHSGAGRRVFLDQACGGDAQLRAEVEAYLSAEGEAGEFLAQPSITLDAPADASSTLLREGPGTIIGNYKLLQVIGEGGFGSVFMAAQEQPVRRRVALKVIKLGMDTKEVVARFEAERQALAMMDHPNIARVLDAGATDSGRPYFVMELVNGIPITAYCDANKLTARQRLELMVPVCRAVQSAHQKGIIHRDLKPSNVMVTLHDGVPVPKVIDFGIAKATGSSLTDKTLFTAFHQFIGTPAYMSPEQAEMSGLDIDTRTDVYGLGVLLYELLTGTTPLDSATLKAAAYNEMARLIREFEPSKPSTRLSTLGTLSAVASARGSDGKKLSQTVRGELDWIVMKALEKDRTRRYESASALADDLGRYLEGEAVAAGPISGTYRMRKLARRYKAAIGVATAVAAVLLLGVAGTTIGLVESNHQRTAALISERKATDEAAVALAAKSESDTQRARAEAGEHLAKERLGQVAAERDAKELARKNAEDISEFLGQVFRSPDPARDGSSITVVEMLDRAVKKLETDLSTLPVQRVAFQFELAQTYFALGLTGKAIPLMEKVRDYHLATDGPEDPVTLITTDNLSNFYVHAGRQSEAINMQEQLLPLARKVLGPEGPETLNVMNNLGGYYVIAGRYAAAIKTLEPALVLDKKVLGRENPQTLNAMALLANAYDGAGDSQHAVAIQRQVLALNTKVLGPEHPQTIESMNNLANYYNDAGHRGDGIQLEERVLALSKKVNGPEHPDAIKSMVNLAQLYTRAGRMNAAIEILEKALPLDQKILGPDHPDTLNAMAMLALTYSSAGQTEKAIQLQEQVLPLRVKVLGPEHPDTIASMNNLALSYSDAGRIHEAIKLDEQVLLLNTKVEGPEHPQTLLNLNNLARDYDDAGLATESVKIEKQVLALTKKVQGPDHPDTFRSMNNQAGFNFDAGHHDEAIKTLQDLLPIETKILGPNDPEVIAATGMIATLNSLKAHPATTGPAGLEAEAAAAAAVDGSHAADLYPKAIRTLRELIPVDEKRVAADEVLEANLLVKLQHNSLARLYLQDAVEIDQRLLGANDPVTVAAASKLADLPEVVAATPVVTGSTRPTSQTANWRAQYGAATTMPATLHSLADSLWRDNKLADAEPLYRELLDIERKTLAPADPELAATVDALIQILVAEKKLPDALAIAKDAWERLQKAKGEDAPETITALGRYISMLISAGKYADAEPLAKRAWEQGQKLHGPDDPNTIYFEDNYVSSLTGQRRGYAEAEPHARHLWKYYSQSKGADDPNALRLLYGYSAIIQAQGRYADAEPLAKQVWERARKNMGDDDPRTIMCLDNYGTLIQAQNHCAAAEPLFKDELERSRRVSGEADPMTLRAMYNYVNALQGQGKFDAAEPLERQILDARRRQSPPDELAVANAASGLGRCLATLGGTNSAEAEACLREAVSIRSRRLGPHAPATALSANALADLLDRDGRPTDAATLRSEHKAEPATRPATTPSVAGR